MLRLKFERLRRHWTQQDLGDLTLLHGLHRSLHHPEIARFETGRANPTSAELTALAAALGVEPPAALLEPVEAVRRENAIGARP